ncbi:MAG: hypothetical protein ACOVME_00670, partial [Rhodobacter sp.]
ETTRRSRGGNTGWIMAVADAPGDLTGRRPLPGRADDLRGTTALIKGSPCGPLAAGRAPDADRVRETLTDATIKPTVRPKSIADLLCGGRSCGGPALRGTTWPDPVHAVPALRPRHAAPHTKITAGARRSSLISCGMGQ